MKLDSRVVFVLLLQAVSLATLLLFGSFFNPTFGLVTFIFFQFSLAFYVSKAFQRSEGDTTK